jgi:hypothetical protein
MRSKSFHEMTSPQCKFRLEIMASGGEIVNYCNEQNDADGRASEFQVSCYHLLSKND